MILLSKFPNFPDELSENDKLRGYELSGSDCTDIEYTIVKVNQKVAPVNF